MKTIPLMLLLLVVGGVLGLLGTPLFTQEPKGSTPATKGGPTETPPPPTETSLPRTHTPIRLIPLSFPQELDVGRLLALETEGISIGHIATLLAFVKCNAQDTISKGKAETMLIALRSGSSVDTGCGPTRKTASAEGLVGYWSFDENSGETALDSSGYDHDGAMVGLPNRVPGRSGTAISLDGIANYVTIPDTRDLQLSSTQTVSTWYKWDGDSRNQWRRLVGKGDFVHRNYGLWIKPQRGQILFQIWEPVSGRINGCEALNSDIPFDNDWHHLAASYDSGTFKLYHDGRLVQPPNQCHNTPSNTDHPVTIGFATGETGPWGDNDNAPFDGAIDEVHIYNRVLSDCEVAELAQRPC